MNPVNWTKKRTWVAVLCLLRAAYILMNEWCMNPFKKSLKDDHVFLTGAGSGIGRLMAIRLGVRGCKLSLSDVNMAGLQETKDLCIKASVPAGNVTIFKCDVSDRAAITQGAQQARAAYGPVTILINNAGVVSGLTTLELSDQMIEKTMSINATCHLHLIREFLPGMIAAKRGHIVTIASLAGLTGVPGLSDYCASKFAAVGIDESIRGELS